MPKKIHKKASKKTYQDYIDEMDSRNYLAYEAIWLTKTFRQFCQDNQDRGKEELETKLQTISHKPEKDREEYEKEWLEWPLDKALDETLRSLFLNTFAGKQVLSRLKVFEWQERAIAYDRELFAEKFLTMRINLTFPKERIRADFEYILNKMHPQVKRPPTPPRGAALMDIEKIDLMLRAYKLVEKYQAEGYSDQNSLINATNDLFKKARSLRLPLDNPSDDKRYRQVRQWHKRVKSTIGDL